MRLLEEYPSGPRERFAKPSCRKARVGSNPTSSAFARRSFTRSWASLAVKHSYKGNMFKMDRAAADAVRFYS